MITIILLVLWILASAHNDTLIEERLGYEVDGFWDFANRAFLGSILFVYFEQAFIWGYSKVTGVKPPNWF